MFCQKADLVWSANTVLETRLPNTVELSYNWLLWITNQVKHEFIIWMQFSTRYITWNCRATKLAATDLDCDCGRWYMTTLDKILILNSFFGTQLITSFFYMRFFLLIYTVYVVLSICKTGLFASLITHMFCVSTTELYLKAWPGQVQVSTWNFLKVYTVKMIPSSLGSSHRSVAYAYYIGGQNKEKRHLKDKPSLTK